MQFQQDSYRIERKDHRDKNLWCFFSAIFAIFVVKFLRVRLAALCILSLFAAITIPSRASGLVPAIYFAE
jgi:hypothetical protein